MNPACAPTTSRAPSEKSVMTTRAIPNGRPFAIVSNRTAFIVFPSTGETCQRT